MGLCNDIQHELETCGKIPMFEIPLGNDEFEIFDIYVNGCWLVADGHQNVCVRLEHGFSLDEHLQALYEKCCEGLVQ